jgi:hypothetical protein
MEAGSRISDQGVLAPARFPLADPFPFPACSLNVFPWRSDIKDACFRCFGLFLQICVSSLDPYTVVCVPVPEASPNMMESYRLRIGWLLGEMLGFLIDFLCRQRIPKLLQ